MKLSTPLKTISHLLMVFASHFESKITRLLMEHVSDWTSVQAYPAVLQVVARTSNRVFVGLPLCMLFSTQKAVKPDFSLFFQVETPDTRV